MILDECTKRIGRYLSAEDYSTRIVNVRNIADIPRIKDKFYVAGNEFINIASYAKADENPSLERFEYDLSSRNGNIFVTGLTSYLKLLGEKTLVDELDSFKTKNFDAHVVILCYGCEKQLAKWGSRDQRLVYDVDGEPSKMPNVVFVPSDRNVLVKDAASEEIVHGIENLADAIETMDGGKLIVKTHKHKEDFAQSMIYITEVDNAFEAIIEKDPLSSSLLKNWGTKEQWEFALELINTHGSWNAVARQKFSIPDNLSLVAHNWRVFNDKEKWLYFICLKLLGAGSNSCLDIASKNTDSYDKLLRGVYRSLLNINPKENNFWEKYDERKNLLDIMGDSDEEILDYLQVLKEKEELAIYYLTDRTDNEKEVVFALLDKYRDVYNPKELQEILSHVYPDLYAYTLPYHFKNDFLNQYFQDYKYQKLTNKIQPEFLERVEEQAKQRDFNLWLPPRSEKVEELNKENARLYFLDAMGVEYLGFILEKCKQKKIMADISICRCELPSLTRFNKEFLDAFTDVAPYIKNLDNIKHQGTEGYDYSRNKLPVHLIKELEVIEKALDDIKKRLLNGEFERAYIIADHGASRLAVINEHENKWEMSEKGEHSGRCCPVSECDMPLDYAIKENGFWVLANYDRFKGSRAANVEVHGGATLEEVTIPIIELTDFNDDIEVTIASTLPLEVSFRKKARLVLFSKTKLGGVRICVNGKRVENKYYDAVFIGNNKYAIDMPEVKYAGEYSAIVFTNNNQIAELKFTVKKEGASERSIL